MMALRLLLHLKSKELMPRVCRFPQRLFATTLNENDLDPLDVLKETKSNASDGSESYFSRFFHETHDPLEKDPKNPNREKVTFEDLKAGVRLENSFTPSHVAGGQRAAVSQDLFPEDVINSELDPEILDTIAPPLPKSFNLASFADKSETIQQLINLGVNLYSVENSGYGQFFLDLDFERDVKNHLMFLKDIGVDADEMGTYLSRNPAIFEEDLDDLKVRIEYLMSKKFRKESIVRIVTVAPTWLNHNTKQIDYKLGFLQKFFSLSGNKMRFLIAKKPKLALCNFQRLRENQFLIQEQMGFSKEETQKLLMEKPKLWLLNTKTLWQRFDLIHNEMKIPHDLILHQPDSLLQRHYKLKERHLYLQKVGRAQYDPKKEGYVSLQMLTFSKEDVFCEDVCKTSVDDFNKFLKSQ